MRAPELALLALAILAPCSASAQSDAAKTAENASATRVLQKGSTRITDAQQLACSTSKRYAFRAKEDYIIAELDVRQGDIVVDIGAGDGWWSERIAKQVGDDGLVHAAEVNERLVAKMSQRFEENPRVRPYQCKTDSTELPENSCDLAFIAQTYHHFDKDGRVAYLENLKTVLKPNGRLCVIERHLGVSTQAREHGTYPKALIETAEKAGWVLVRYELMPNTYHYLTIFAQREMFPEEPERRRGRRRRGGD